MSKGILKLIYNFCHTNDTLHNPNISDYIRTFTWDKKVEMLIKSSGILGGHGKLPTVVSPELYRMRFCEAMDSYFLWIPDRWTGLGKGVDG
ncbi:1-phosphatidylinositol 3-phosphate 5-kinase [Trichonephila inaurata madagascariensis]|uniref:1-phosphatidylinositol 3-phosphate 5-kinase n=1 Tax=Trichonephila inaurata madagascariensis TaxID=2747483 RepID=A0A8X6XUE3_9ARAC|nr:1-phosphatidylinositol 3-phosphate 5-kinase [Trichonephila inaurata madagascariensis]